MADIFGNSTLPGWQSPSDYSLAVSKTVQPAQWGHVAVSLLGTVLGAENDAARTSLQAQELQAKIRQTSVPPPRNDASATPRQAAPAPAGGGVNYGPEMGSAPAWMSPEPIRGNVLDAAGGLQAAPAPSVVAPSPERGMEGWGGPNFSWNDAPVAQSSSQPRWMAESPGVPLSGSQRASDWSDFEQRLAQARMLPAGQARDALNRLEADNADWSYTDRFNNALKGARADVHQRAAEGVQQQRQDIALAGATGVTKAIGQHADNFSYVMEHGTAEERAQATAFSDHNTYAPSKLAGGLEMPNPQSQTGMSGLRASITAREAKAAGLVPSGIDPKTGEMKYERPRVNDVAGVKDFQPKTYYDEHGNAIFRGLVDTKTGQIHAPTAIADKVPADAKAMQENNKLEQVAALKELNRLQTAIKKPLGKTEKQAVQKDLDAAVENVKRLKDEHVVLSTNYVKRAESGERRAEDGKTAVNPPSAQPKPSEDDPFGLFGK